MALETLKDVEKIDGFKVGHLSPEHVVSEEQPYIIINHNINSIGFIIQNGPIKEVGINGCQVQTIIAAAKTIIEGLNKNFPCRENAMVITKLDEALLWSLKRTMDREQRNVEGLNKA